MTTQYSELLTILLPLISTGLGLVALKFKGSFDQLKLKAKTIQSLITEINTSLEDNTLTAEEAKRIIKLLRALT